MNFMIRSKQGKNAIAWAILALFLVIILLTIMPGTKQTAIDIIGAVTAGP